MTASEDILAYARGKTRRERVCRAETGEIPTGKALRQGSVALSAIRRTPGAAPESRFPLLSAKKPPRPCQPAQKNVQ